MPKTSLSIYMTFTFFLLCMFFWLQTDAFKSEISKPAAGTLFQTDAEVDRLLLQEILSKQKKAKEKQQPMDTWNSPDVLLDENLDSEDWIDAKSAVVSSRPKIG